jgi:hypothetical protein
MELATRPERQPELLISAVQRARTAEAQGNPAEAMRQWRIVFGNEFPSYG